MFMPWEVRALSRRRKHKNVQFCSRHHASRLSVWGIGGYCPLHHGCVPVIDASDEELVVNCG
jgi:hypothetical protein